MEDTEIKTCVQDAFDLLGIPKEQRESISFDLKASDIYKKLREEEIAREKASLEKYAEAMEILAKKRVDLQAELGSIGAQFKMIEKMMEISQAKIEACDNLNSLCVEEKHDKHDKHDRDDKRNAVLAVFQKEAEARGVDVEKLAISASKIGRLAGLGERVVSPFLYNQERSEYFQYFERTSEAHPLSEREFKTRVYWKITDKGYEALISML